MTWLKDPARWPADSSLSSTGRSEDVALPESGRHSRRRPSTALATTQPAFTNAERVAVAGYLAGYRGLTREAYALDLRQFTSWCRTRSPALFAVRRADIEGFARELEAAGQARATVTRRLSIIAGFYKYAVEDMLLDRSPAAHVPPSAGSTTSPMPSRWTATSWARSLSRPGWARHRCMR